MHKSSGLAEQGYFEAIYHKQKPVFLTINKDQFRIYPEVTAEGEIFEPKEFPSEFPYEAYSFFEGAVLSREDLFWKIQAEFNLFLDVESIWKDYLAACVLLSYQQEKLRTVPYPYFVGDNESGKTVALNLLKLAMLSTHARRYYSFSRRLRLPRRLRRTRHHTWKMKPKECKKTKIKQNLQSRLQKRRRSSPNRHDAKQTLHQVLPSVRFKACAAEEIPRVKGLLERFIFIPMTEGIPNKDWADLNETDEQRLRELRNMLLKWRMASMEWKIPDIELPVKGRLKELWKPVIQIISGLTVEKDLRTHLEVLQKERLNERANTLEGHIVKVVCELYVSGEPLAFSDIWDALVKDLEGKTDERNPTNWIHQNLGKSLSRR